MDSNPVMERMLRLSEQWRTVLIDEPALRMVCWGGSSLSEYRMIKGFIQFHMSEESTLDDIFILCGQPFSSGNVSCYGKLTGEMMNEYIQAWNEDEALVSQGGKIDWIYKTTDGETEDILEFVKNINSLADYLIAEEPEEEFVHLVIAILPGKLCDFEVYREWVRRLLSSEISPKVRFMLYDQLNAPLLDVLKKQHVSTFKYLIPDMDLQGAAHEILENAKQECTREEDKAAITFQQRLLYLSDAVAKGEYRKASKWRKDTLQIAQEYLWAHLEAVVHYLMYSLYYAQDDNKSAEAEIDLALSCIKKALETDRQTHLLSYCQYLAAKAMLFLMRKHYEKAAEVYDEGISVATELENSHLLAGLYQMHGICLRETGRSEQAWHSFVAGWNLSEESADELPSHPMYKFYAREMMKVNIKDDERRKYMHRFEELWGKDWEKQIQTQLRMNSKEYKIFER